MVKKTRLSMMVIVAAAAWTLSACGQKGPLYLPAPPKPPSSERPADMPAPAEKK